MNLLKINSIEKNKFYKKNLVLKNNIFFKSYFYKKGYTDINIVYKVKKLIRNRVLVIIYIKKNNLSKIQQVDIYGNKKFDSIFLKKILKMEVKNYLSWIKKNNTFSKTKLNINLSTLKKFYMKNGYLDFKFKSCIVYFSKNKKSVYISINLKEGELFKLNSIFIKTNMIDKIKEFYINKIILPFKTINYFSLKKTLLMKKEIKKYLTSLCYFNIEVKSIYVINDEKSFVNIIYEISVGKNLNIRNINVYGNKKQSDEIIRRLITLNELDILKFDYIKSSDDSIKKNLNLNNIKHDFCKIYEKKNYIDINYHVEEDNTSKLELSFGYSETRNFIYKICINENNFFNTGKQVNFILEKNKNSINYQINYCNPCYTLDNVGIKMNFFYKKFDIKNKNYFIPYIINSYGYNISYIFHPSLLEKLKIKIGFNKNKIKNFITTSKNIKYFLQQYGKNFKQYFISLKYEYNSLDNTIFPKNGLYQSFIFNSSTPFSSLNYYTFEYKINYFKKIKRINNIIKLSNKIYYGNSYYNTAFPFFKNHFLGGIDSIRGFLNKSVGPKDSQDKICGGNISLNSSINLIFPDLLDKKYYKNSSVIFCDFAQIYNSMYMKTYLSQTKCSIGIGFECYSPLGPLVFNLAAPIIYDRNDEIHFFSFKIGSLF